MGTYNPRPIRFRQSQKDFPMIVALGEKSPTWGMRRWRGDNGLTFIPPDDEGYSLRGDARRLEYRGRRRSHRFSILSDSAFEYDIVLSKEPESNVITLRMDGAERFDFHRQPDFVSDPFLRGSYAVYKKVTLIGEGTGKLCHLHRPEIIDARGRRCWGELSIVGNELRITIPANWLGGAKYPVVIDPAIGTTTVGSQFTDQEAFGPVMVVRFNKQIPVNRYLLDEAITGSLTGHAYTFLDYSDGAGRPVLYGENASKPYNRLSSNEGLINFRVNDPSLPEGWRSGSFNVSSSIAAGTYVWFGISTDVTWVPRFDWSATCYAPNWTSTSTPATYPTATKNYMYMISMYLSYVGNYVRKLTQGVTLTESPKERVYFRRTTTQTALVTAIPALLHTICLKCFETVICSISTSYFYSFLRTVKNQINVSINKRRSVLFIRKQAETVTLQSYILRKLVITVRAVTQLIIRDYILSRILKAKSELVIKSCVTREITLESKIA